MARMLALALVAAVALASKMPTQPAAFTARDKTDLLMLGWFPVGNCTDSPDIVNVAASATNDESDLVVDYAHLECIDTTRYDDYRNGLHFKGTSDPHVLKTKSTIDTVIKPALIADCSFTVELWLQLDSTWNFDATTIYTFFEISTSVNGGWSASTDMFQINYVTKSGGGSSLMVTMAALLANDDAANSLNFAIDYVGLDNMVAEEIYHIVITRDAGTASPIIHVNTGTLVGASTGYTLDDTGELGGFPFASTTNIPAKFKSYANQHVRVGSSKAANAAIPGSVLMYALHNSFFDAAAVGDLYRAGLPNNAPKSKAKMKVHVVEDTPTPLALYNADKMEDPDGNSFSYFIVTPPAKGDLSFASTTGSLVTNAQLSTFTYQQKTAFANQFDTWIKCKHDPFDSMVVRGWDGVCGGAANFANTDCHTQDITVSICVDASNDKPLSQDRPDKIVREGTYLQTDVKLRAVDIDQASDLNNTDFELLGFLIESQSNPELGNVTLFAGGVCTTIELELPFNLTKDNPDAPFTIPTASGTTIVDITRICYAAAVGEGSTGTVVGTDTVTFRAIDGEGKLSAAHTQRFEVRNSLLAGCAAPGSGPVLERAVCSFNVAEENIGEPDVEVDGLTGFTLLLQGHDALNDTNSYAPRGITGRIFRIDSVPSASKGKLYLFNTNTEILGGEEIAAVQSPGHPHEGMARVTFVPATDYFNRICLGRDYSAADKASPCATINSPPKGPGGNAKTFRACDKFGVPIDSCPEPQDGKTCAANPTTFPGCGLKFAYSMGYDEGAAKVFSPSEERAQIFVYNINDAPILQVSDKEIPNIEKNANPRDKFTDGGRKLQLKTTNPDEGDSRMVALSVRVVASLAKVSNRDIPTEVEQRLEWVTDGGDQCLETGCTRLQLYGYQSDINVLLQDLEFTTTRTSGEDEVEIKITHMPWEETPVPNFPTWVITDDSAPANELVANATIVLKFGDGNEPDGQETTWWIYAVAFGSAAALGLICFVGISTALLRARQGEKLFLWVFRNILCTEPGKQLTPEEEDKMLGSAAHGTGSAMERAAAKEARHMQEVLWCVHCLACIFPCCIKYDKSKHAPSKEDLMEKALAVESDRLAGKHLPGGDKTSDPSYDPTFQSQKEDLETDTIADDSIFDWERHLDKSTGRHYYYNPITHESRWTPPEVVVHSKTKKKVVSMRKSKRFKPKPPTSPKEGDEEDGGDIV